MSTCQVKCFLLSLCSLSFTVIHDHREETPVMSSEANGGSGPELPDNSMLHRDILALIAQLPRYKGAQLNGYALAELDPSGISIERVVDDFT